MSAQRYYRFGQFALVGAGLLMLLGARTAQGAGHFDQYVDPNYTSTIYAGPMGSEGVGAWTLSGHLLTRGNSNITEYAPIAAGTHQGTSVHNVLVSHPIANLSPGAGITNGLDGYLYAVGTGPNAIQRIDPNTWGPAVNMLNTVSTPSGGYSINTLPNGNIVYSDSGGASKVYVYNPVTQANNLIFTAGFLVDDIETGPGGEIALAGQSNSSITILTSTGAFINSFSTPHYPDGLAFGDGPYGNSVYANNNDGSITRYDLSGVGYTGTATAVDIALTLSNHRGYGDLATVGPDCAFYIGTFDNPNFTAHGNTAGIGTNWDNGTSNSENSVVRIGFNDPTGANGCAFYSLTETFIPEPTAGVMLLMSLGLLAARRRQGLRVAAPAKRVNSL